MDPDAIVLETRHESRAWPKLLRVHQWVKNALVFVPLVTAQRLDLLAVSDAVGAFMAFSLAASAIYILNDLVDLDFRSEASEQKATSTCGRYLCDHTGDGADPLRCCWLGSL